MRRKSLFGLATGVLCTAMLVSPMTFTAYAADDGYNNLVWSDEFEGNEINKSNWKYEIGNNGWGNNELEYYTDRGENSWVSDGMLTIKAMKENYEGAQYTSARMKSEGLQSFKYGKLTARIKLPVGQGIWPAFWMLGDSYSNVGWPSCGELDIMEHVNLGAEVAGTAHWSGADGNYTSNGGVSPKLDLTQFHEYTIIWDESNIKWYVDDKEYKSVDIKDGANGSNEFHEKFFFLLNVAVGGNWPGSPNDTTPFPAEMKVDYVRVYQKGEAKDEQVPGNDTNKDEQIPGNDSSKDEQVPGNDASKDEQIPGNDANTDISGEESNEGNCPKVDPVDNEPKTADSSSTLIFICSIAILLSGVSMIIYKKKKSLSIDNFN